MEFLLQSWKEVRISNRFLFSALALTVLILLFKHLLIRVMLFSACSFLLARYGKLPFGDFDPVPLAAGLILLFQGMHASLLFSLWALPLADILSTRISQWTFVNLVSLLSTLFLSSLLPLHPVGTLVFVIVSFNLIRLPATLLFGGGINSLIPSSTHTVFYLTIISLAGPVLEMIIRAGQSL